MSDTQNNTQNAPVGAPRPADAQQNNQSGNGNAAGNSVQTSNAPTYTQEQLDSMVSAREERAGTAALKSFFEQQGMSEDEVKQAISAYRTNREKSKPDVNAITAQAEHYKAEALKAQIESKATLEAMNLGVDTAAVQYVLRMADFAEVTDDQGKIDAEKIKAAVSKVLEDVPQLKKEVKASVFTQIGAGTNDTKPESEIDRIRKAYGLKPKN